MFEVNGWALPRKGPDVEGRMEVVTYDLRVFSMSHMPGTEPPACGECKILRSGDPSRDGCHGLVSPYVDMLCP